MTETFGPCYEETFARAMGATADGSRKWMMLTRDCPVLDLETLACTLKGNPKRPEVCDDFTAGSEECLDFREVRNKGIAAVRFANRCRASAER